MRSKFILFTLLILSNLATLAITNSPLLLAVERNIPSSQTKESDGGFPEEPTVPPDYSHCDQR